METEAVVERRAKLILIVAVVVFLFAFCAGVDYLLERPKDGVWVDRLEADLNEHLPLGSTVSQAKAWFDSQLIRYDVSYEPKNDPLGRVVAIRAFFNNDSILEVAFISISLEFDSEGRLGKREIHRIVPSGDSVMRHLRFPR